MSDRLRLAKASVADYDDPARRWTWLQALGRLLRPMRRRLVPRLVEEHVCAPPAALPRAVPSEIGERATGAKYRCPECGCYFLGSPRQV